MAGNELTINASLVYDDEDDDQADLSVANLLVTVTTQKPARINQYVTTSPVAINLGGLASVGFVMFVNRDPTNFIEILSGTGGVVVGKLLPGENYGPVRLGSGMQAPFAQANTDICKMAVLLCAP